MTDLSLIIKRELLPFVEKPGRYLGNELHSVHKDLTKTALHGILCFPDLYDIGMSHLGTQILYSIVNNNGAWAASRCYQPWIDALRIMRQKEIPLFSLEYGIPCIEADWLGFSVQYELQYTNIISMLAMSKIPLYSAQRNERHPLILAGGPCMSNPEPLAEFFDACVIGDGEEAIVRICSVLEQMKACRSGRKETLEALHGIQGVYVPLLHPVVKKGPFVVAEPAGEKKVECARVASLSDDFLPGKQLVPLIETVHHRLAVEVMRGCTHGCRFCSAGFYYRPLRERQVQSITDQITRELAAGGWENIGLLSLSTADYSCFYRLVEDINRIERIHRTEISLPSTRIDALDLRQIDRLDSCFWSSSFTIAPEAGSQRLRSVINKQFSEQQIIATVTVLLNRDVQTIKLYFMIGLPTETMDDIQAITDLIKRISGLASSKSKRRMINVSLSPFSPKAHTPFQWEALEPAESLTLKATTIKRSLSPFRNVHVSYRNPDITLLETLFSRGDRSLGRLIVRAWEKGCIFDGWEDMFRMALWKEAAAELSIPFSPFLNAIPKNDTLPWDHINVGVDKKFLLEESEMSTRGEDTPDCKKGKCNRCGACATVAMRLCEKPNGDECAIPSLDYQETNTEYTTVFHYRFVYQKGEGVCHLSHKNITAALLRALRATKVPLVYSQGFHPHPRVSFGPPLSLGIMGNNELFDISTFEPVSCRTEHLDRFLPDGLRVHQYYPLNGKPLSLQSDIIASSYCYTFDGGITESDLDQAIMAFNLRETLPFSPDNNQENTGGTNDDKRRIHGVRKKGPHSPIRRSSHSPDTGAGTKDMKSLVYSLTKTAAGGSAGMEAVVAQNNMGTVKPLILLKLLFPDRNLSNTRITRTACLHHIHGLLHPIHHSTGTFAPPGPNDR